MCPHSLVQLWGGGCGASGRLKQRPEVKQGRISPCQEFASAVIPSLGLRKAAATQSKVLTWYKPGLSRNTDEGAVDKDKASSFQNENADVQLTPGQLQDYLLASSLQDLNSGDALGKLT